ncbi:helix-turn-helix domain-containing protein [Candidatus Pacearchaeota archaeon]|jgi:ABC-type uncharacterized transport system YnjBCD substrate-binding protein|nr:helix-turn-helix domain-containing protein [Candidatus Pacearchaeota archaeon]
MPHTTIIKKEFADAVREVLADITPNQASYKTGVSDEYIRKMASGRVPSEVIIERFANGMGADLTKLRIAAGYEQSTNPVVAVNHALSQTVPNLSEFSKKQILDLVREVTEEVDAEE